MTTDSELLQHYLARGSGPAFGQLVERHLAFVYRVCRREVGDDQLAEDAALAVFLLLSQKARSLRSGVPLTSWLFTTARFTAKNAARQEHRRKAREQRVGEMAQHEDRFGQSRAAIFIETHMNDALAALSEREREAVLLRYQDDLEIADVGRALGISEDAAKMRLSRGLEKMRRVFTAGGTPLGISAIASALITEKSQAAPAALLAKVKSVGTVGRALPTLNPLFAKGILIVSTTKIVAGAAAAVVLILALTLVAVRHEQSGNGSGLSASPPPAPGPASSASSSSAFVDWRAAPASDPASQQAQQQIKGELEDWTSGIVSGDAQKTAAIFSPDYAHDQDGTSNGRPVHIHWTHDSMVGVMQGMVKNPFRIARITVLSCQIAGNTATIRTDGHIHGADSRGSGIYEDNSGLIFVNTDGKWLMTEMK